MMTEQTNEKTNDIEKMSDVQKKFLEARALDFYNFNRFGTTKISRVI